MKILFAFLFLMIIISCAKDEEDQLDGHWHFVRGSLFETIDINGETAFMNKAKSGYIYNDTEIIREKKIIKYLLGDNSHFQYQIVADTLVMESIFIDWVIKAHKVENCSAVQDWFYNSPLSFDLPKISEPSDEPVAESFGYSSLAFRLAVSKEGDEVKMAYYDKIIQDYLELEKIFSYFLTMHIERVKSNLHAELYIDKTINFRSVDKIVSELRKLKLTDIYIVVEGTTNGEVHHKRININELSVNSSKTSTSTSIEELINRKRRQ